MVVLVSARAERAGFVVLVIVAGVCGCHTQGACDQPPWSSMPGHSREESVVVANDVARWMCDSHSFFRVGDVVADVAAATGVPRAAV